MWGKVVRIVGGVLASRVRIEMRSLPNHLRNSAFQF